MSGVAEYVEWYERLFGTKLVDCREVQNVNKTQNTADIFKQTTIQTIGVYFSFANINAHCDELVGKLKQLHERLNAEAKSFEVVQVVLWAHNDVYNDFETSHRANLLDLPWFAIPFSEIDLKTKLSRRYRIKSGVPTLVLLDKEGNTITPTAQDRLMEDPLGTAFPWRPRPLDQVLRSIILQPSGAYSSCHSPGDVTYDDLLGVRGIYFSANWCPPCRAFTPQLAEVYRVIRKKDPQFEVIFVSSDRSDESFSSYIATMPWLAVPFHQAAVRSELAQLYGVRGIPTLLLLDGNGHVITMEGRSELADDPSAKNFPWKPRPVNVLTERYVAKLHDYPALVLFIDGEDTDLHFAESVLTPAAERYYSTYHINYHQYQSDSEPLTLSEDLDYVQFLIALESDASDLLRDLIGLDDVVPLLVAVDIRRQRYAVMKYGQEVTVDSVTEFAERFRKGDVQFQNMHDRLPDSNDV